MTTEEKAIQLVDRYRIMIKFDAVYNVKWNDVSPSENSLIEHNRATHDAKLYAIATANEVIEQEGFWITKTGKGDSTFWKEVIKEIEKL